MTSVVTHIGLAVPDLDLAIDWYSKVLGFMYLPVHMILMRKMNSCFP